MKSNKHNPKRGWLFLSCLLQLLSSVYYVNAQTDYVESLANSLSERDDEEGNTSSEGQTAAVGLFIRRTWRNFTSINQAERCYASSCAARVEEGCAPNYNFLIEDACQNIPRNDFSHVDSDVFYAINETHYCEDSASFESCAARNNSTEPTTSVANNGNTYCNYPLSIGECPADDPGRQEMIYLPEFCIQSPEPMDGFVVPFVETILHKNESTCAEKSEIVASQFLPYDPNLCTPNSLAVSTERVMTGYTRQCLPDGTTLVTYYSDPQCQDQSPALQLPTTWTVNQCTPTHQLKGQVPPSVSVYSADCTAPTYHCKDLKLYPELLFTEVSNDTVTEALEEHLLLEEVDDDVVTKIGLILEREWYNWTNPEQSFDCQATSCDTRVAEGCIAQYKYFLENQCYQYSSRDFSEVRSEQLFALNTTNWCEHDYQGPACGELLGPVLNKTTCYTTPMGYCPLNDPTRDERFYFPDFCIISDTPLGPYTVPMVDQRFYANLSSCENDNLVHNVRFIPTDPNFCIPIRAELEDEDGVKTIQLGGLTRTCNADGTTTVERFTDASCTEQDPSYTIPFVWTAGAKAECTIGGDATGDIRFTEDCLAPKYFCKDFTTMEFFDNVGGASEPQDDESDETNPAAIGKKQVDGKPAKDLTGFSEDTNGALSGAASIMVSWASMLSVFLSIASIFDYF